MIDLSIVGLYFILILSIGIIKRAKGSSIHSYGSLNIDANRFLLIATIFASAVGGGTVFGLSEKAFSNNNIAYTYALLITIIVDILIAKFLVPRLKTHHSAISMGDIMEKYYGKPGKVLTGAAAALISLGYLAAQINVSGKIFEYILDINRIEGVILSYVVVMIYTTIGGIKSIIFVNLLQFIAMIIAVPMITIFGIYTIGYENFVLSIPVTKYTFENPYLMKDTLFATLNLSVMGFYPTFIQRVIISQNVKTIQSAILFKSIIYAFFIICVTLNGFIAFSIDSNENSSLAIPYMIDYIMPIGLKGIAVAGLLSAVMSTADSDINIASISIVKDILEPIFNINTNSNITLVLARIFNVIFSAFGIILALKFDNAVDLVIFAGGFWNPMILPPLVLGLFGITVKIREFMIASFVGSLSFIFWSYYVDSLILKGAFVGSLINFVIFTLLLFTNRKQNYNKSAC